ncbi:DUF452 family protein [Flammeovirgaceae bacterium SG7u.111]|nr:DUF452 family protein [Flammeovirgaceae bacterium SG7u.132]WPO36463.1 DUF452 family protein [Flammeovirgaceae bacterium SG7u.111]
MDKRWLNKKGNKKCILFFNGWGMDENAIKPLGFEEVNLCHFNKYTELEELENWLDETIDLAPTQLYLVAWSMGVWAAEQVLSNSKLTFEKKVAINGTGKPVSKEFGIPEPIFRGTLEGWDEANRTKFNLRMMGGRANYQAWSAQLPQRTPEEQKTELQAIYENSKEAKPNGFVWDKAIIGTKDLIFPSQNQHYFWEGKCEIEERNIPHFPFGEIKDWEELIM